MLNFVRLRASDRQRRLFACACCRLVWDHLDDPSRHAVEAGEVFADGGITNRRREAIRRVFNGMIRSERGRRGRLAQAAEGVLRPVVDSALVAVRARTGRDQRALLERQCALVREVFDNLFFRRTVFAVTVPAPDSRVGQAAREIYDSRAFEGLPGLVPLLEASGWNDPALFEHLRSPGPHAPGCWALDRLLALE
jgi:hypothetical protein